MDVARCWDTWPAAQVRVDPVTLPVTSGSGMRSGKATGWNVMWARPIPIKVRLR